MASILQKLPVVLQRLQRRQNSFLADAVSAILALSMRLFAVGAPCQLEPAFDNEQHDMPSNLSDPQQPDSRAAESERLDGSGRIGRALKHLLQNLPSVVSAWPESQAQSARATLKQFTLQMAALTASLPTVADAPVLAALPPQEAAALLDRDSQCQSGQSPAQTTCLIAACMLAMQQVAASGPVQSQRQESNRPCSKADSAEALGDDSREGSAAQLGKAVMLHAALTLTKCRAALGEQMPPLNLEADTAKELPSCITALLQAASQSQVQAYISSVTSSTQPPCISHFAMCCLQLRLFLGVQSEVAAKKAMALVTALSLSNKGVTLTLDVKRTGDVLLGLLSSHPVQPVRNAAYYAMQHLLDSFQVRYQVERDQDHFEKLN